GSRWPPSLHLILCVVFPGGICCGSWTLGRQPLLRAVQPGLALRGELLTAFPQRDRRLEREATGLELPNDVEQFVAGRLIGDGFASGHRGALMEVSVGPMVSQPV